MCKKKSSCSHKVHYRNYVWYSCGGTTWFRPQRYFRYLGRFNKELFVTDVADQEEQDVQDLIEWLIDMFQEELNLVGLDQERGEYYAGGARVQKFLDDTPPAGGRGGVSPITPATPGGASGAAFGAGAAAPFYLEFRPEDLLMLEKRYGSEFAAALCWARVLTQYRGFCVDTFQGQMRSTVWGRGGAGRRGRRRAWSFAYLFTYSSIIIVWDCPLHEDDVLNAVSNRKYRH